MFAGGAYIAFAAMCARRDALEGGQKMPRGVSLRGKVQGDAEGNVPSPVRRRRTPSPQGRGLG